MAAQLLDDVASARDVTCAMLSSGALADAGAATLLKSAAVIGCTMSSSARRDRQDLGEGHAVGWYHDRFRTVRILNAFPGRVQRTWRTACAHQTTGLRDLFGHTGSDREL